MKKTFLTLSAVLKTASICFSQESENIDELITDRPDQTESASIVPVGSIQLETGGFIEKDNAIDNVNYSNLTYNTSLFRIGLTKTFELRLIQEIFQEEIKSDFFKSKNEGFGPLAVGGKFKISEENGLIPEAAFLTHVTIPTGKDIFRPQHAAMDFRFIGENTLSEKWGFAYNFGGEWSGDDLLFTGIYTAVLGTDLTNQVGLFLESYGFITEGMEGDHRFDAGFTYSPKPLLQFDISAGVGLTEVAPDYFVSLGLSTRFLK